MQNVKTKVSRKTGNVISMAIAGCIGALTVASHYAVVARLATARYDASPDPKKLVLLTPNMDALGAEWGIKALIPGADVVHAQEKNLDEIIATLVERVKKYGTLDEFAMEMDSIPNKILFAKGPDGKFTQDGKFTTFDFLNRMIAAQEKLGQPLARRIEFLGCNVFTDPTPESVTFYRDAAAALGADIVGTRSRLFGGFYQAARFVVVRPNGNISNDRLDNPYDLMARLSMRETVVISHRRDDIFAVAKALDSPAPGK
jgi:hypothetical protein